MENFERGQYVYVKIKDKSEIAQIKAIYNNIAEVELIDKKILYFINFNDLKHLQLTDEVLKVFGFNPSKSPYTYERDNVLVELQGLNLDIDEKVYVARIFYRRPEPNSKFGPDYMSYLYELQKFYYEHNAKELDLVEVE
jgi:hypothetical protein